MKRLLKYALWAPVAGLLAGCDPRAEDTAADAKPVEIGPKYSAKDGLLIPEDTRRSLGVRFTDVTHRPIRATIEVQLRLIQGAGRGPLLASALVPPSEAGRIQAGHSVRARVGEDILAGEVKRVNRELETATGLAEVLVEIPEPEPGGSALGAFVPASIDLGTGSNVMCVPRAALLECSDGQWVYTVNGEHLVRAPVRTGASDDGYVEITEGLYEGDRIVAAGAMPLWMTELAAVKGGQACCVIPPKGN